MNKQSNAVPALLCLPRFSPDDVQLRHCRRWTWGHEEPASLPACRCRSSGNRQRAKCRVSESLWLPLWTRECSSRSSSGSAETEHCQETKLSPTGCRSHYTCCVETSPSAEGCLTLTYTLYSYIFVLKVAPECVTHHQVHTAVLNLDLLQFTIYSCPLIVLPLATNVVIS